MVTIFLQDAMISLAKKLASRIVLPVTEINLEDDEIFKPTKQVFMGGLTKTKLSKLLNDGDISQAVYNKFFTLSTCMHYCIYKRNSL